MAPGDEAAAGTGALTETIELCSRDGADGPAGCASWGEDTYLDEEEPTTPHGMEPVLLVSALGAGTPAPSQAATLIRFDVAHIRDDVLRGGTVSSAAIWLYSENLAAMGCYSVTEPGWTEDAATWDTAPGAGTLLSFHHGAGAGWAKFEVTGEIRRMLEGGDNHGFRILGSPVGGRTDFNSRESGSPNRPRLELSIVPADFVPVEPTPPPLDRSAPTTVYDAMNFLLDPALGLQPGVVAGAIDVDRAAVIRGRVYDRDTGAFIPGVRVSVLGQDEFGAAITRVNAVGDATGNFEILLNGGEAITLVYEHEGYLRSERTAPVGWNDWARLPDVALVSRSAFRAIEVAGPGFTSAVTEMDARGRRTLSFYVPPGTAVVDSIGAPDMTACETARSSFVIRAAEYTTQTAAMAAAGRDPAEAMPAGLPATTNFTYATELEVSASSTSTTPFEHPVFVRGCEAAPIYLYLYVGSGAGDPDHFFTGDAGTTIPHAKYDDERGAWISDLDGTVIHVAAGGGDCVNDGFEPEDLVPAAEAEFLCDGSMPAGEYWRVPLVRFSPIDLNFPLDLDGPPAPEVAAGDDDAGCSNKASGSIIHCEAQSLGERMPIHGTPFSLGYVSDRHVGRRERYLANIDLFPSGSTSSTPPVAVYTRLRVAGATIEGPTWRPGQPLTTQIWWDGRDNYGRDVVGPRAARLELDYEYPARYAAVRFPPPPSGGSTGGGGGAGAMMGGFLPPFGSGTRSRATGRGTGIVPIVRSILLGTIDDRVSGIAGWRIDAHHIYDPANSTLYLGDGTRRSAAAVTSVVRTAIVVGPVSFGRPLRALTIGPDETLYYYDGAARAIMMRTPGGVPTALGEVGPATWEEVRSLSVGRWWTGSASVPVLYARDTPRRAIYRIRLDSGHVGEREAVLIAAPGSIEFGSCTGAFAVPPCIAPRQPMTADPTSSERYGLSAASDGLVAAPDGSVYFGDVAGVLRYSEAAGARRVELVVPVAAAMPGSPGSGRSSVDGQLTLRPDGALYWLEEGSANRVLQLTPTGSVVVALAQNDGASASIDEGAPANCVGSTCAYVGDIRDIALDREGNLCIAEGFLRGTTPTERIRCLRDGRLYTVAGIRGGLVGAPYSNVESGRPATRTDAGGVTSFDFAPDGRLFFTDTLVGGRVRVVEPAFAPDLSVAHTLASADGAMLYDFDEAGRHLGTRDAITGVALLVFGYDSAGRLVSIRDVESSGSLPSTFTTIDWSHVDDAAPYVRIVAPGGIETRLGLNAAGYVESFRPPEDGEWTFFYEPLFPGLLTEMIDARGGVHTFAYDTLAGPLSTGRLLADTDALDSGMTMESTTTLSLRAFEADPLGGANWRRVDLMTPGDGVVSDAARRTTFRERIAPGSAGRVERRVTEREGTLHEATTHTVVPADGAGVTISREWAGSFVTITTEADPRAEIGLGAPYPAIVTSTRPDPSATPGDTITSTTTLTRCVPSSSAAPGSCASRLLPGETLRDELTPPAVTGGMAGTFVRTLAPRSPAAAGFVVTSRPASGLGERESRIYSDHRGRTTRIEVPGEHPTCIEYPAGSNSTRPRLIRQSAACGATGVRREVTFRYDDDDDDDDPRWLLEVTAGTSSTGRLTTSITPDGRGWSDLVTLPGGGVIDVDYDEHGSVTAFRPPGRASHGFTYTARDSLDTYVPPAATFSGAEITETEYRPDGSLLERSYRNGAELRTTLNLESGFLETLRVAGDVSPSGVLMPTEIFVESDPGGRPTLVETTMGDLRLDWHGPVLSRETWLLAVAAGAAGSILREVGPAMLLDAETATMTAGTRATSLRIGYGYDVDRLLTSAGATGLASVGLPGVRLGYTFAGGATLTATASAMVTTSHATMLGELESSRTESAAELVFETRICERDEHGRIVRRVETWRGSGSRPRQRQLAYTYDARGFLSFAGETPHSVAGAEPCFFLASSARGTSYTYDAAGNRSDLDVNAEDQARVGGRGYDALGHLASRGDSTYAYDAMGHLRSTSSGRLTGGPRPRPVPGLASGATYDYDALGRLTAIHGTGRSTAGEQRFIYRDALNPIAWSRPTESGACRGGTDTLFFVYASMEGTPDLAYVDSCTDGEIDATWRYLPDERGSVRFVIDVATGAPVQEITYDAWGLPTFGVSSASVQPFGYIGGIYDAETGFWRLGARDYDPSIGRWTTKDPIGFDGGMNLYAYCLNDPLSYSDPSGLAIGFTLPDDPSGLDPDDWQEVPPHPSDREAVARGRRRFSSGDFTIDWHPDEGEEHWHVFGPEAGGRVRSTDRRPRPGHGRDEHWRPGDVIADLPAEGIGAELVEEIDACLGAIEDALRHPTPAPWGPVVPWGPTRRWIFL